MPLFFYSLTLHLTFICKFFLINRLRISRATRDHTKEFRAIHRLVNAHSSVALYPRVFELLEQRLTLAQKLQNQREEFNSFKSYAEVYEQLSKFDTARNFCRRAITVAKTIQDNRQELALLDRLTQISYQ
ncbi:MAG: hypothetical protein HRU34_01830 [Richelia sp.]|nr:hypothetical protein [Richelia sp.]